MRLLAVLLLAVALSGCFGDESKDAADPEATGHADGQNDTVVPGSPDPTNPENHIPSAILEARNVTGVAPLTVSFTLNGTDVDRDNLTWVFDSDGDGAADANGTELPYAINVTYEAGNYTANFTVSDGSANHTASISINVTEAMEEPPAPEPRGPTQVVDGSIAVGVEGCPQFSHTVSEMDLLSAGGGTLNERTRLQFDVDGATAGMPWLTEFDFDVGYLYAAVAFFNGDGDLVGGDDTSTDANTGDLSLSGTVPASAGKAVIWACAGPTQIDIHYEA